VIIPAGTLRLGMRIRLLLGGVMESNPIPAHDRHVLTYAPPQAPDRFFLAQCSCGYQASATRATVANEAIIDHARYVTEPSLEVPPT
jgi:hypothetical protein